MPNTVALSHQILRIWPAFDLTERSSTAQCSAVGRWQIGLADRRELLAMGLGYKLVVAPLLILVLYAGLIDLRGRSPEITLFEAAMPPQIGGSIVGIQYGLDARLISLIAGIGAVAAFLTLPAWWRAFEFLWAVARLSSWAPRLKPQLAEESRPRGFSK